VNVRGIVGIGVALLSMGIGPVWTAAPDRAEIQMDRRGTAHSSVLLAAALALLPAPRSLAAQDTGQLTVTVQSLARSWAGGSDRGVVGHLAHGRVSLHLEGGVSAALPTRQAVAVIRDYLRSYDAGEVEVARVALVEGSGERGFAEFRWSARRSGTSQTLVRTVFLGFRYEDGGWTVDEVRVLP